MGHYKLFSAGPSGIPKLYASPTGSDTNDGRSWGSAFKTYQRLIAESNSLGGCIAWARYGTWSIPDRATASTGPGLNLRGSYDQGTGATLPDWITVTSSLTINVVPNIINQFGYPSGAIGPGGGAANFSGPPLQICGNQVLIEINGLDVDAGSGAFPAFRYGLSSPLRVWSNGTTYASGACVSYAGISYQSQVGGNVGNQPDTHSTGLPGFDQWSRLRIGIDDGLAPSLSAGFVVRRCQYKRSGVGGWPTIESGYGFFGKWEDVVITRTGAVDPTLSTSAGFRMCSDIGSNVATYNQVFSGITLNGGGFWSIGANNLLTFRDVFGENMVTPSIVAVNNAQGGMSADLNNVFQGDSPQPYTWDFTASTGVVTASGPVGEGNGRIYYTNQNTPNQFNNGLARSQYGVVSGLSITQHDGTWRKRGEVACPYPNVASPVSVYGGATSAGHAGQPNAAYRAGGYMFRNLANATLAVGDRLAFGCGIRFITTNPNSSGIVVSNGGAGSQTILMGGPNGFGGQQVTLAPSGSAGSYIPWFPQWPINRYEWKWIHGWLKVVSLAGAQALQVECNTGTTAELEDFWCIVIPAADNRSDSEVAALAMYGGPSPNVFSGGTQLSPAVGDAALFAGQSHAMWDETLGEWRSTRVKGGGWTGLRAMTGLRVGSDLTDASVTKNPASDAVSTYSLLVPLTANRVLTLGVAGTPITGAIVDIVRRDTSAFTYTIKDDLGATLFTSPASPATAQAIRCRYNGTHYEFVSFSYVA